MTRADEKFREIIRSLNPQKGRAVPTLLVVTKGGDRPVALEFDEDWELHHFRPSFPPRGFVEEFPQINHKVDAIQRGLSRVQGTLAKRKIWRLAHIEADITSRAPSDQIAGRAKKFLRQLHAFALDQGIECLPGPQVERCDGGLAISWFDLTLGRSVKFLFLEEEESQPLMTVVSDHGYAETENPSPQQIQDKIAWIAGV